MTEKNLHSRLSDIQTNLKAPKGQMNTFGNYKYRSCEDILEAVKPLLNGLVLTIGDEIILVGDRYYVKATAVISDGKESIINVAYARESFEKKGMDSSQVTGATSSYARKYALNGLLLIDDTKDMDTMDNTKTDNVKPSSAPKTATESKDDGYCEEHKCNVLKQISKSTGKAYYFCPNLSAKEGDNKNIYFQGRPTDGHFIDDPNKAFEDAETIFDNEKETKTYEEPDF